MSKLRWWIAAQLDRLPGQCWADLVTWALDWPPRDSRLPWRPATSTCRLDAEQCGACYCGKLRAEGAGKQPERAA